MTTFDSRQKAFEDKYMHDQELQFKVTARRNKLLGLWAARLMDKEGAAAEQYAKDVVASDFEEPGDDDVLRKVQGDLAAAGIQMGKEEVRVHMQNLLIDAKQQILTESGF